MPVAVRPLTAMLLVFLTTTAQVASGVAPAALTGTERLDAFNNVFFSRSGMVLYPAPPLLSSFFSSVRLCAADGVK